LTVPKSVRDSLFDAVDVIHPETMPATLTRG